jgi:alkylhydroperoxidase family enzyme
MPRLPYLTTDDLAAEDRELLARDLNLYYELAHSPSGARAFAAPALYVRHDSPLDARLRELAILQVGYATRAEYEYAHHIEIARDVGVSDAEIRAVALETAGADSGLGAIERAVLSAAREIVDQPKVSDKTFATLQEHLDAQCIVDLVLVISFYCAVVRVLGVLQIDLEASYAHYLTEFPLPD